MVKCVVEFSGLSSIIPDIRNIEIELNKDAGLKDLIAALRSRIPALEGSIICSNEDKLLSHYAFYMNGRFHLDDSAYQIQSGDRIMLVAFALGG